MKSPYSQIKKKIKIKTKLKKVNDEFFNYNYQVDENTINNNMSNTNYCSINNRRKTSDSLQKKIKDILLKKVINTEYVKKKKHKRLGNLFFIDYRQNIKSTKTLNNTDNY